MNFIRNLKAATTSAGVQNHAHCILMKEIFLLSGYTFVSDNADAAWGMSPLGCIVTNRGAGIGTGFDVSAPSPRIIYDPLGSFTAAHASDEYAIFLYATNAQNKSGFRITRYIDANNVEIDADAAPPNGWATEQGIAGRVVNIKAATLASGAWVLLRAPGCNLQVRLLRQSTTMCRCYVRPLGGAGTATEIPSAGLDLIGHSGDTQSRINAVLDGKNVLIYSMGNYLASYNSVLLVGELSDAAAADTNPGFIQGTYSADSIAPWGHPMYMLNGAGIPAQISAYPVYLKQYPTQGVATIQMMQRNWLIQNGRPGYVALRKPGVVLDNVLNFGACGRGKLPLVRHSNVYLERWRPIETAGNWLYTLAGLVVPRNGPNDRRIVVPYAV